MFWHARRLKKQIARRANVIPGTNEKARFHVERSAGWGKGRSHPPSPEGHSVDETAIMAEYSAGRTNDQAESAVTRCGIRQSSSDSASGKSKGRGRFGDHGDGEDEESD